MKGQSAHDGKLDKGTKFLYFNFIYKTNKKKNLSLGLFHRQDSK